MLDVSATVSGSRFAALIFAFPSGAAQPDSRLLAVCERLLAAPGPNGPLHRAVKASASVPSVLVNVLCGIRVGRVVDRESS